jgi:hypothetical protein
LLRSISQRNKKTTAIIKIQTAARAQAAMRCFQFKKAATIKIQAAARAQVAMQRSRVQKAAIIKIQTAARAQAAMRCVQFKKAAIIKIQAAARAQVVMRRFQFQKAAIIKLQTAARARAQAVARIQAAAAALLPPPPVSMPMGTPPQMDMTLQPLPLPANNRSVNQPPVITDQELRATTIVCRETPAGTPKQSAGSPPPAFLASIRSFKGDLKRLKPPKRLQMTGQSGSMLERQVQESARKRREVLESISPTQSSTSDSETGSDWDADSPARTRAQTTSRSPALAALSPSQQNCGRQMRSHMQKLGKP